MVRSNGLAWAIYRRGEGVSRWRRRGRVCARSSSGEGDGEMHRGAHGAEEAREHGEEEDGDEQIQNATVLSWAFGGVRR